MVSRKNKNKQPSYSEQHCIDAMKNVSEQMNESAKITAEIDKAFCNYIYEENE